MLGALTLPTTPLSHRRIPAIRRRKFPLTGVRVVASLPDNDGVKLEYTPWLIVGLGNPGNKYHGTRHNVGSIGEVPVLLAKPQAYMNYSGESVGPLAAYYQVPLRHILVIYDEMSLPNGVMRLQPKGGHGHHNGLKNVMDHLDGCREFPRLCIGIGNPPGTMDMRAYLLQKFNPEEYDQVESAMEQGVDAVRTLVLKGFTDSITRFNLTQKYKYHKV
ncbi:hypothetical protein QJS04_geneDACA003056 [Acorus gramineus]|uniref:Uncharacterized protein n=1 Tax=Acorus gramineus TaxID=55184 RepID=A0AAV9BSC5_ACOGR|nr:hypothetical protein QJS04_geneDACA003056 [Acorus gramineus]